MAAIRVSSSVERLINDVLKRLPISQTKQQFIEGAVARYVRDLKRRRFQVWWCWRSCRSWDVLGVSFRLSFLTDESWAHESSCFWCVYLMILLLQVGAGTFWMCCSHLADQALKRYMLIRCRSFHSLRKEGDLGLCRSWLVQESLGSLWGLVFLH